MIKNRIKELREEQNETLIGLMRRVNSVLYENRITVNDKPLKITDSQLSFYENGKRSPRNEEIWEALSKVFKVSVPYLKGDSNIRDEKKIQKYAEEILLKGIEAEIPNEFTNEDTANLEIKYLFAQIEHISSNTDIAKRNFLINIMRNTLDIYELMDKFIDDKPYEDFEILFDKFKNLISKVTDNDIVTGNFYEQLADFDDEIKEFYIKNKDN